MIARILSFGLQGIEAYPIEIEVSVSWGLPAVNIVGLPDCAVRESKERVKSAINNSGFQWPAERITISLAPSGIRKEGTCFDLGIALGILYATGQINFSNSDKFYILGELSLDGTIRPVKGILPIAMEMANNKQENIILPSCNAQEAAIIDQVNAFPVKTLKEAIELINNPQIKPLRIEKETFFKRINSYSIDFSEVKGQYLAKRAIEIAVSGGHNIAMIGPAGSGKTMLAKRIPTIMPDLVLEEALEITKIQSATGLFLNKDKVATSRPFRDPHHTISNIGLIGGGSIPVPGEISLAHQGVLFLDELPEFSRESLESLRQPLEEGRINLCRIKKSFIFPASFILVAALNPCPCGFLGDPNKRCRCSTTKVENYIGKISGPLLDRIDIHIQLPRVKYKDLSETKDAEPSFQIKARVEKVRHIQRERFKHIGKGISYNAQMDNKLIKNFCLLDNKASEILSLALIELGLSARAYDKILKVSRTIADLAGSEHIQREHVSEAVQYRILDRRFV